MGREIGFVLLRWGTLYDFKMPTKHQAGSTWTYSVFGCFSDCRLCLMSFFCPCVQIGRNAEYFGENCCTVGFLSLCGLPYGPIIRNRLRAQRDIKGSMTTDVCCWICLPWCSLTQESREIKEAKAGRGTIVTHTSRTVHTHVYKESSSSSQPLAMARA